TMTSCTMQASDLLAANFARRFYRVMIGGGAGGGGGEFAFQEASPNLLASEARQSQNTVLSSGAKASAATAGEEVQMTPDEQFILIEAERLELQEKGDPEAMLLPPTPLSSPSLFSKANRAKITK
ncbi:MAG TPA: hypothetical protein VK815_05025, partial [Candidatus Acidoferrales bacterium]|nr:hypothetical protein [Candidatus Acidoferrales bacterium]